jgi:hypothetical protein
MNVMTCYDKITNHCARDVSTAGTQACLRQARTAHVHLHVLCALCVRGAALCLLPSVLVSTLHEQHSMHASVNTAAEAQHYAYVLLVTVMANMLQALSCHAVWSTGHDNKTSDNTFVALTHNSHAIHSTRYTRPTQT